MKTKYEMVVSASDLDELGHVNNARYLNFLEVGRMDWYARIGMFDRVAALHGTSDINSVVVNINIDFNRECLLGEQLMVNTTPERFGFKCIVLHQSIQNASGATTAAASVTSVIMHLPSRTALILPENLGTLFPTRHL